ncbi:MAG TPA: DNA gyrase C-terminal beta-propeller domain-containing protein, partial [Arachidicoccus sp.]
LVGILDVTEKQDLIITCKSGITLRTGVVNIKEAGRNTQGVILIRLDDGDEIAAISKIEEQEEEIILEQNESGNENIVSEENGNTASEENENTDKPLPDDENSANS